MPQKNKKQNKQKNQSKAGVSNEIDVELTSNVKDNTQIEKLLENPIKPPNQITQVDQSENKGLQIDDDSIKQAQETPDMIIHTSEQI